MSQRSTGARHHVVVDRGTGTDASRRAVAFVEAVSDGGPLPPGLDVTVHFHPDRLVGGVPLLRHLVTDGVYRSQFETGTGNGGLTAYPGGDRWRWEHRMFGGAYDDAPAWERPKYGALNLRRRPAGGSVRFGSSHLRLARPVLARTTFCWPDSHLEPARFGTARRVSPLIEAALASDADPLDDYVEAHVHGPLVLGRDVAALVLDPSFRGTAVEAAALDLGLPVEWHHGFVLTVPELRARETFRGPGAVETGVTIARDGRLDARVIGEAAATRRHDPQRLKQVWHCVARFGSPA